MSEALMGALQRQNESLTRQVKQLGPENERVRKLITEFDERHDRDQAEIAALQKRLGELEAALAVVDLCDATGGEHQVERQGNYRFCKACGETMTEKRIRDAKRASAARATFNEEH